LVLSFNFPDVTWRQLQQDISQSEPDKFCDLKRSIWYAFCELMIICPKTAVFRVIVEAVTGDRLGKAPTTAKASAGGQSR
jgi:hypothetical protein